MTLDEYAKIINQAMVDRVYRWQESRHEEEIEVRIIDVFKSDHENDIIVSFTDIHEKGCLCPLSQFLFRISLSPKSIK